MGFDDNTQKGLLCLLVDQVQMSCQKFTQMSQKKTFELFWISFMFDKKLHRQAAANIDFRRGENVGKQQKDLFFIVPILFMFRNTLQILNSL